MAPMTAPLAARMSRLGSESAFAVLARARAMEAAGRRILPFAMGEPDFATPEHIVEAGVAALREGWTHYGPAPGFPDVRAAIADYLGRSRGLEVQPERVIVTPGAKPIMFYTMLALVEQGTEVLVPDPAFPIYESMVRFSGGTPIPYALPAERRFTPDPAALAALVTPRTRLLILNSPGNPCGGVQTPEDIAAIAALCREKDLRVLSDEIYCEILYEGAHRSILAEPGMMERTILLDGFSKAFAMTGWRAGYGVLPPDLVSAFTGLQINSVSCTSSATQRACLAALTGPMEPVRAMVARFRERRDVIVRGINTVKGFHCEPPRGAFYAWVDISGTGLDGRAVADRLLEEAGLACVAGIAFGKSGANYVRFSFAASLQTIAEAVVAMRHLFGHR